MKVGARPVIGALAFALLVAGTIGARAWFTRPNRPSVDSAFVTTGKASKFTLNPSTGELTVESGTRSFQLRVLVVVDGATRTVSLRRAGGGHLASEHRQSFHAAASLGGDVVQEFSLDVLLDPTTDTLRLSGRRAEPGPAFALAVELHAARSIFVSGVGEVWDQSVVDAPFAVIDDALGVSAVSGPLSISPSGAEGAATQVAQFSGHADVLESSLAIVVATRADRLYSRLFSLGRSPLGEVAGTVTGANAPATVLGRDGAGAVKLRMRLDESPEFRVRVPLDVIEWYAVIDSSRASPVVSHHPSTNNRLILDVSPGGELALSIVDPDRNEPITARVIVRGVDGTVDPSFGPDYRASGAGVVLDALAGTVRTPLARGRYRVLATKGIEWSIDERRIEIEPGKTTEIRLSPRRVVPTPDSIACDLHVHARPSFDSPVSVEDRVVSLVSAGVEFAVPSEHNVVGNYQSAIETLGVGHEFSSVPGIEVTTAGFGHFNIFPLPLDTKLPVLRGASYGHVTKIARTGDYRRERVLQVNHPRMKRGIGYFNILGFDPKRPQKRGIEFDALEVMNGHDDDHPERSEVVLRDYYALLNLGLRVAATGSSDSHRIQYMWAGYPRTQVRLPEKALSQTPPDSSVVVAGIKAGRSVVTNGPLIEARFGNALPGDEYLADGDPIVGHVRVRAAPWVDITEVAVIVGGERVQTFAVPSRSTVTGPEDGLLSDAEERTVRFDSDVSIPIAGKQTWVIIVARGKRRADDVLPYMPFVPFGFTNPIFVRKK